MGIVNRQTATYKALATNTTADAYAAHIPTTTKPASGATGAIIDVAGASWIKLTPFGTNLGAEIFEMKLIGWSLATDIWIPEEQIVLTCTLGNEVGIAGATVLDTDFFCDTLAVVKGVGQTGTAFYDIQSASDEKVSTAYIRLRGHDLYHLIFDRSTAASSNCLYSLIYS